MKFMFGLLQGLPLIRFALMLGGGMMASGGTAWVLWLIAYHSWPKTETVALAQINALAMIGAACLAIIGVVMIALAFGKIDKMKLETKFGSIDVGFEDETPAPSAPLVTTTTTVESK